MKLIFEKKFSIYHKSSQQVIKYWFLEPSNFAISKCHLLLVNGIKFQLYTIRVFRDFTETLSFYVWLH